MPDVIRNSGCAFRLVLREHLTRPIDRALFADLLSDG